MTLMHWPPFSDTPIPIVARWPVRSYRAAIRLRDEVIRRGGNAVEYGTANGFGERAWYVDVIALGERMTKAGLT